MDLGNCTIIISCSRIPQLLLTYGLGRNQNHFDNYSQCLKFSIGTRIIEYVEQPKFGSMTFRNSCAPNSNPTLRSYVCHLLCIRQTLKKKTIRTLAKVIERILLSYQILFSYLKYKNREIHAKIKEVAGQWQLANRTTQAK